MFSHLPTYTIYISTYSVPWKTHLILLFKFSTCAYIWFKVEKFTPKVSWLKFNVTDYSLKREIMRMTVSSNHLILLQNYWNEQCCNIFLILMLLEIVVSIWTKKHIEFFFLRIKQLFFGLWWYSIRRGSKVGKLFFVFTAQWATWFCCMLLIITTYGQFEPESWRPFFARDRASEKSILSL